MKFKYELTDIGWADVEIEINGQKANFSVSYLTNALGDLVENLILMTQGLVPDDEIRDQVTFEWDEEPAIDRWVLRRMNGSTIKVDIVTYPAGIRDGEKKVIIDTKIELYELVEQIVACLEKLLMTHGLVGFRQTWYNHDFPLTGYLRLKYYLENRARFPLEVISNEGCKEKPSSSLQEELNILSWLINR